MEQGLSEFEKTIDKIVGDIIALKSVHTGSYQSEIRHIPMLLNPKHELRYLKDLAATRKGVLGVKRLHRYLPLMEELVQNNLFPELPRPYRRLVVHYSLHRLTTLAPV